MCCISLRRSATAQQAVGCEVDSNVAGKAAKQSLSQCMLCCKTDAGYMPQAKNADYAASKQKMRIMPQDSNVAGEAAKPKQCRLCRKTDAGYMPQDRCGLCRKGKMRIMPQENCGACRNGKA